MSIIGLGASGRAAARLARAHGGTVHVSDTRTDARLEAAARELRTLGADVDLGRHDLDRIQAAATVVVSPGIPPDAPVLRSLRARGVEWIGEPEFALGFHQGSLIAVTGTNGKTTTAALIAHLMQEGGIDAALGGNVGGGLAPAASELLLREPPPRWLVLELSSFQLAGTRTLRPAIGVVTSLAPDHLDRYDSVEDYYADKARLFRNATEESRWVLNAESGRVLGLPGDAPGTRYFYRLRPGTSDADAAADVGTAAPDGVNPSHPSGYLDGETLTIHLAPDPPEALVSTGELGILGRHNVLNALGAAVTAGLAGVDADAIRRALRSFRPLPHRMEPVGSVGGVLWVNDSKATNVEATGAALGSLDRPVVALLGGKDKGEDFRPLADALARGVRAGVVFGEAGPRLRDALVEAWGEEAPCELVLEESGFDAAVERASRLCVPGDLLLLSPACSSFDEFENYEARGRRFAALAEAAGVES